LGRRQDQLEHQQRQREQGERAARIGHSRPSQKRPKSPDSSQLRRSDAGQAIPETGLSGSVVPLDVEARARLRGRLVVILLGGLLFLRGDVGIGEHPNGWWADTNPTASSSSRSTPRSAAAASPAVNSASGSACNRSSGMGRPLRRERP
jgi:hypothetical protein